MDEWHCALTLPRTRACRENTSEHDVYSMRTDVHDRRTYNNRSDSRTPCAMPPPYPISRQPPQSHRTRHRATEGQEQSKHPRRTGRAGERHRGRDRNRAGARAAEGVRGDLGGAEGERIGQANHGSENAPRTGTAPAEGHSPPITADGAQGGTESRRRGFSCAV